MKKLVVLLFFVTGMVACEGPEGPRGPQGEGMNWGIQFFEVRANQWENVSGPDEVRYRFVIRPDKFNELSLSDREFIYDHRSIKVFMFLDYDTNNETQRALPFIENWLNAQNQTQLISYTYDYSTEDVAVYFTFSGNDWQMPQSLWFRIVMNW